MKKVLNQGLFLAGLFLGMSLPLGAHASKAKDQSVLVSKIDKPIGVLVKEALLEKAQVSIEALSGMLINSLAVGKLPVKVDLENLGAQLLKMHKFVLEDIQDFSAIRINNGTLIVMPGEKDSISYVATPAQKDHVVCASERTGVELGLTGKAPTGSEKIVIFVATYAGGRMPDITATGGAQVFLREVKQSGRVKIALSDTARCTAQGIAAETFNLSQKQKSEFNLAALSVTDCKIDVQGEARADFISANITGNAAVRIKGVSADRHSAVRMQGSAARFDVDVANGQLESPWFRAQETNLYVAPSAVSIELHAGKKLVVAGPRRGFKGGAKNKSLVIKYSGKIDPNTFSNTTGIPTEPSLGLPELVTSPTSRGDLLQRGQEFVGGVRKLVSDGASLGAALKGLFDN